MSRQSSEWCCMNCTHMDECLSKDPKLNLFDYCLHYKDIEDEQE